MNAHASRLAPDPGALLEQIEDLKVEVAYLRSELAMSVELDTVDRLKTALKVTTQQAKVLAVLHQLGGRPITYFALEERIARRELTPGSNLVRSVVSQIRENLGHKIIRTVDGVPSGYAMSAAGLARVQAALDQDRAQ